MIIGVLFLSSMVTAAEINYKVYKISINQDRELIFCDKLIYSTKDIRVITTDESDWVTKKQIILGNGFLIEMGDFSKEEIVGFGIRGLYKKHETKQFSWEWFTQNKAGTFIQYHGGSRVDVKMVDKNEYQHIVQIKLIDDVSIDIWAGARDYVEYKIVLLKGSELIFPE